MSEELRVLPDKWGALSVKEAIDKVSVNGKKIKQSDYLLEGKWPIIDQGQDFIGGYSNDANNVISGTPPYIVFGDHTKAIKFVNFQFIPGADGIKVLKPKSFFDPKLFYYFLQAIKLPDKGYARHFQYLEKSIIPLPPPDEQQRIVARIEELFTQLDAGVAGLEKVRAQVKRYRQAVLQAAVRGEYSGNCRFDEKNWERVKLKEVAQKVSDGEHFRPNVYESGVPFLSAKDILNDGVSFENTLYVNEIDAARFRRRCDPSNGDVLVVSRGATIGRNCVVNTNQIFCLLGSVIQIRLYEEKILPKFLSFLLKSPEYQKLLINTSGSTAQQAIYLRDIKEMVIPLPQLEEQKTIIDFVDQRISNADQMEKSIEQSLRQSARLRQSILQRAFCGKL